MTTATVVLLALMWGGVLLPGLLRDRRSSPVSTVDGFHNAMARLASCDRRVVLVADGAGRRQVYPRPSARTVLLERRRQVLVRLGTFTLAAVVTALLLGGVWWVPALLAVGTLAAYCAALRSIELQRQRTRRVVVLHPTVASTPQEVAPRHVAPQRAVGHDVAGPVAEPLFAGSR